MDQCMRRRIGYQRLVFADGPTSAATIHVTLQASFTGNVERVQADLAARVGPGIHAVHVERAEPPPPPPGPNDHIVTVIGGAERRALEAQTVLDAIEARDTPALTDALAAMREREDAQ